MKQERGGTFIGFIVGVVVGLGAALAVAVYVTKVPVPFTNKSQSRSPEQDDAQDVFQRTDLLAKIRPKPSRHRRNFLQQHLLRPLQQRQQRHRRQRARHLRRPRQLTKRKSSRLFRQTRWVIW